MIIVVIILCTLMSGADTPQSGTETPLFNVILTWSHREGQEQTRRRAARKPVTILEDYVAVRERQEQTRRRAARKRAIYF